jgi:two-component system, chemotaxis family, CheB/CheR fusion protein
MRRARLRILLVDDNVDGVETLAEVLRHEGHTVTTAHDGESGLAWLQSFRPDLAILDLGLPKLDGFALAARARAEERLRSIPLIALSAYDSPAHRQRATEAGFDHHLSKPPNLRQLEELLLRYADPNDRG